MGVIMRGGVPYGNFDRNNLEIITTPLEEVEDKKEDLIYVVKDNIDAAEGEAWCWDGEKAISIGNIKLNIDKDIIPLGDGNGNLKNSGVKYFNYIKTTTIPGSSGSGFPRYFPNETSFYVQDTIAFLDGEGGTVNVVEKYTIDEVDIHNFNISISQNNSIFTVNVNDKTIQIPMSELSSTATTYTIPDTEIQVNVKSESLEYGGTVYYSTLFTFILFNFEIDASNPPSILRGEIVEATATYNSERPGNYNNSSQIKSKTSDKLSSLTRIRYNKSGVTIMTSSYDFISERPTPSREEIVTDDNMLQAAGDKPFRIKLGDVDNTGAELILKDNMQTVIGGSGVINIKDKYYLNIHNDGMTSINNASLLRQGIKGGIKPNDIVDCAIINILGMPAIMIQDQAAVKIAENSQIILEGSSTQNMKHNSVMYMEGNSCINMQTIYSSLDSNHDQSVHKSPYFNMNGGCSFIMQGNGDYPANPNETDFPAIICEKDKFTFDSRMSNGTGNFNNNGSFSPMVMINSPKHIDDTTERSYFTVEGNTFVRFGAGSASYAGKTNIIIGGKSDNGSSNPTTEVYIDGNSFTKISNEAHLEFQDYSKFYNLDESIFVMRNSTQRDIETLSSETSPKFEMIGKCSIETTVDGITINGVNFTNTQLEALKSLLQ